MGIVWLPAFSPSRTMFSKGSFPRVAKTGEVCRKGLKCRLAVKRHVFQMSPNGINSLPNDKFLDRAKLKAFSDDKFNIAEIIISDVLRVENIVGKGENAALQHFLLFPKCFPKAFFSGSLKLRVKCMKS